MEHERKELDGGAALVILSELAALIPPCPQCEHHACVQWIRYKVKETLMHLNQPTGPMGMLVALVKRQGPEGIIFEAQELEDVVDVNTLVIDREDTGGHYRARLLFKPLSSSDWPDVLDIPSSGT